MPLYRTFPLREIFLSLKELPVKCVFGLRQIDNFHVAFFKTFEPLQRIFVFFKRCLKHCESAIWLLLFFEKLSNHSLKFLNCSKSSWKCWGWIYDFLLFLGEWKMSEGTFPWRGCSKLQGVTRKCLFGLRHIGNFKSGIFRNFWTPPWNL